MVFVRKVAFELLYLQAQVVLLSCLYHIQPAWGAGESKKSYPEPILVPSSQTWDGNDGSWSTFSLQIGTPPQTVKVFASTASHEIWAVAPEGCQSGDPINCRELRGEFYNFNSSSTWEANLSDETSNIYPLGLESALGYRGRGRYGFDDITLGYIGSGGPQLKNQTIAAIGTQDYFMGLFGLNPRSSNFTNFNNPIPSFIQNLQNQSMIPSLSWAYTAGNKNRVTNVYGSLVLGGYDASRFISKNITFPFNVDTGLAVSLASIVTGDGVSLLSSPIQSISLDSTIPYLYLPEEACELFEKAFRLTWNNTAQLYILNETQHSELQAQNPSVTFTLGSFPTTIDITLPYSAFDLTASWPLVADPAPYFPLKRASNETQYVLGRTFFQEAYIIANYEIGAFSVFQCDWDTSKSQNIVTIFPLSYQPNSTRTLSKGAIVGIGVGGSTAVIVSGLCIYFYCFKSYLMKKHSELDGNPINNTNTITTAHEAEEYAKPELDSTIMSSTRIHEAGGRAIDPIAEMADTSMGHTHVR